MMSGADREGNPGEPGTEQWRFKTGELLNFSPTVADGTVYVGNDDGHLYAVGASSGEQEWAFEADESDLKGALAPDDTIRASPTVADETVYVWSEHNYLYAVGASRGEQEWALKISHIFPNFPPTVADGTVYVGSNDENLYAVDAASGEQEWAFETGNRVNFSPTVVDGTVYVGNMDGNLYAVDAASGTEEWVFNTGGRVRSPPTVADGTVCVGNRDGNLYAVDGASGEQEWAFENGDGAYLSSPTVVDGTVYVGSRDTNLYAVDAASGEQEWAFEAGNMAYYSSPTVVDGMVYVGNADNNLCAVDGASGEQEWAFETENRIGSSPTVVDGTVYVGDDDGTLCAVDAASGEQEWAFETGSKISLPTVADETVYVGSVDENLYAVAAATGREGLPASARLPVVEAPTEQVPAADAATSPPRRPGLSHEALRLVEEIGAGGQAIITEAQVPEAQQPPEMVALREPDTSATLTREAVETFLRQAETWATVDAREREKQRWVDSEHIVGVIATGDRQPWLAMEYMDGGDLAQLLAEHPDGLPVGQALWTGECVCKGLEVAHNLGKVHLDVKPGNVLLRETDGWPWPKLADWGLSRTLAEETGTMEGLSVQYAAPEQFDSTKFGDPDQLTDIYQTGALVYALLTGEPPTSGSQFEVMQQVMSEGSITPPSQRRPELPAAVDAAVGLALEREKTERYGSIGNFGDALHALRTGGRLPPAVAARLDE